MGPFVPELISDQLNLIVALLIGIGFGFALEQAGFSSSRRLAGVFYGYDFTVLRVFFTAAVTAMSGIILLSAFGLLDAEAIYVNPTWLVPTIVGGVIMGLGFIIGGYCPGTSVCAAAIGKVDAMFFVGGGFVGVFAFGELYPLIAEFNDSTYLGPVTVYDSLGISQGLFAFVLIAIAVMAFTATSIIERKVNPQNAPSLRFPKLPHRLAGAGVVALGAVFLFLPSRADRITAMVSNPAYESTHVMHTMPADELAFRILDKDPRVKILDIRSAEEYEAFALPVSQNVKVKEFFGKDWRDILAQRHTKKVVVGNTEAEERTAALVLKELGYENVAILEGGMGAFRSSIFGAQPDAPVEGSRDADVIKFRRSARAGIEKAIAEAKAAGSAAPKKTKQIKGGC